MVFLISVHFLSFLCNQSNIFVVRPTRMPAECTHVRFSKQRNLLFFQSVRFENSQSALILWKWKFRSNHYRLKPLDASQFFKEKFDSQGLSHLYYPVAVLGSQSYVLYYNKKCCKTAVLLDFREPRARWIQTKEKR